MAQKKRREAIDPVYVGGDARVPSGKLAELDASDEKVMRIRWDEGNWEVPYERITVIYVSLSRPSAMVITAGCSSPRLDAATWDSNHRIRGHHERRKTRAI